MGGAGALLWLYDSWCYKLIIIDMNCGLEKHPMLILDPLDAENHLEVLQLSPWMWKIGGLIRPSWS